MRNFEVKDIRTIKFEKPTTIFVCDPCYVFDYTKPGLDGEWQAFVGKMFEGDSNTRPEGTHNRLAEAGTLEIAGATMLYTSTAHGDGCYEVITRVIFAKRNSNRIEVDSGMICAISKESAARINPKFDQEMAVWMGAVVYDFKGEITATGKGFIGDLTVDTEGYEEEDDE